MSIVMPESEWSKSGSEGIALEFPSGATGLATNTGVLFGFWVETLPQGPEQTVPLVILSRESAAAGGNDSYIQINSAGTTLEFRLNKSGFAFIPQVQVAFPALGEAVFVMVAATETQLHFATCLPGGTPNVTKIANTILYERDSIGLGGMMFSRIGSGGSSDPFYGSVENFFFLDGELPEDANGDIDAALIQNIADGTQDIAALHLELANGAQRSHYPLRIRGDYSDASPAPYADLTVKATTPEDADLGRHYYSGRPLRPGSLQPTKVGFQMSQLAFATAGDETTATANIPVEGGAYDSFAITPATIEARLVKEDGTEHVTWTVIDATPAGGNYTGHVFQDVPYTPEYLELRFRAVDSGGTPISDEVASSGLRGTGFVEDAVIGQSQMVIPLVTSQGTYDSYVSGTRSVFVQFTGNEVIQKMVSSSTGNGRKIGTGFVSMSNEIQKLFPGAPMQIIIIGQAGEPLDEWDTGGQYVDRIEGVKDYLGVIPPDPTLLFFGHSAGPGTRSGYLSAMNNIRALFEASNVWNKPLSQIGVLPTPRYAGLTGGAATTQDEMRAAMQDFVDANPGVAFTYGSTSGVKTGAVVDGTQPHPSADQAGTGVTGSLLGLGLVARAGGIPGGPGKLGAMQVISDTEIRIPVVPANS